MEQQCALTGHLGGTIPARFPAAKPAWLTYFPGESRNMEWIAVFPGSIQDK